MQDTSSRNSAADEPTIAAEVVAAPNVENDTRTTAVFDEERESSSSSEGEDARSDVAVEAQGSGEFDDDDDTLSAVPLHEPRRSQARRVFEETRIPPVPGAFAVQGHLAQRRRMDENSSVALSGGGTVVVGGSPEEDSNITPLDASVVTTTTDGHEEEAGYARVTRVQPPAVAEIPKECLFTAYHFVVLLALLVLIAIAAAVTAMLTTPNCCATSGNKQRRSSSSDDDDDDNTAVGPPVDSTRELFYTRWLKKAQADGVSDYDQFGFRLDALADGTMLVASAIQFDLDALVPYGHGYVRVFELTDANELLQVGDDITGKPGTFVFGFANAISQDFVAASAFGYVQIFQFSGTTWNLYDEMLGTVDDLFGWDVVFSEDGQTLAISAVQRLNGPGFVRIFRYDGRRWSQLGLDIEGESVGDNAGHSISLSSDGNLVAIGAPTNNNTRGAFVGHVKVFRWDQAAAGGGGRWSQYGSTLLGGGDYDGFGFKVSFLPDGSCVAVGAPQQVALGPTGIVSQVQQIPGNRRGIVEVYCMPEGGDDWDRLGNILVGFNQRDQFGTSLALRRSSRGYTLAVASPNRGFDHQESGTGIGSVRFLRYDESKSFWIEIYELLGENQPDNFGRPSMSQTGSVLVTSAPGNSEKGVKSGRIHIYRESSCEDIEVISVDNSTDTGCTQLDE